MMSRTTEKAEAWDLGEVLAVLCQVAQDARGAESAPQAAEDDRIAGRLPGTDEKESRP